MLVHLNRAMGTHSTQRYTETLSAVRFGEGPRRRARDSALDSVMTADSAVAPGAGGSSHKSESTLDAAAAPGEKATVEMRETVQFADGGAMV